MKDVLAKKILFLILICGVGFFYSSSAQQIRTKQNKMADSLLSPGKVIMDIRYPASGGGAVNPGDIFPRPGIVNKDTVSQRPVYRKRDVKESYYTRWINSQSDSLTD